jgi:hypothetical protein
MEKSQNNEPRKKPGIKEKSDETDELTIEPEDFDESGGDDGVSGPGPGHRP